VFQTESVKSERKKEPYSLHTGTRAMLSKKNPRSREKGKLTAQKEKDLVRKINRGRGRNGETEIRIRMTSTKRGKKVR